MGQGDSAIEAFASEATQLSELRRQVRHVYETRTSVTGLACPPSSYRLLCCCVLSAVQMLWRIPLASAGAAPLGALQRVRRGVR